MSRVASFMIDDLLPDGIGKRCYQGNELGPNDVKQSKYQPFGVHCTSGGLALMTEASALEVFTNLNGGKEKQAKEEVCSEAKVAEYHRRFNSDLLPGDSLHGPQSDDGSDLFQDDLSPENDVSSGLLVDDRTKKPRKARTAFTDSQLSELELNFEKQKYLSVQDRMQLANRLKLNDTQVKTWYQNRRTKWKRQTAVGLELLAETGNYLAVKRILQTNPYWAFHPATEAILANMESISKQTADLPTASVTLSPATTTEAVTVSPTVCISAASTAESRIGTIKKALRSDLTVSACPSMDGPGLIPSSLAASLSLPPPPPPPPPPPYLLSMPLSEYLLTHAPLPSTGLMGNSESPPDIVNFFLRSFLGGLSLPPTRRNSAGIDSLSLPLPSDCIGARIGDVAGQIIRSTGDPVWSWDPRTMVPPPPPPPLLSQPSALNFNCISTVETSSVHPIVPFRGSI